MPTLMSVSGAPSGAQPKNARLRKRLRACLPHFHAPSEPETEADDDSESAVKLPSSASAPVVSRERGLDVPVDTNHSWSDTEEMSPVSFKPSQSLRKRRQYGASPCSSPSSASSSSSTSSSVSAARKGVTYGQDGALVSCRFCEILQAADEPFLYEDEDVVVFRPLAPVVVSHILVVPRRHIRNVNKLTPEDAALLRRMRQVAASVLRGMPRPSVVLAPSKAEQRAHDATEDTDDEGDSESDFKFAFHSPPFNSIDHVHMHAFRTRDGRFGCVGSIKYRTETWWCRSFDEVMARLGLRGRKQHQSDASTVESMQTQRRLRHHASHPPCCSEVHTNGSRVLTSVESLG